MDMDTSMSLGLGATPGLLGDSHLTPMQSWPRQQQPQGYGAVAAESPELGVQGGAAAAAAVGTAAGAGESDEEAAMDVDADENAPPASPAASPAAAAGGAAAAGAGPDVDGLTTNLLLDDQRQLPGWGHVPLGGAGMRPSPGGAGGLTTHTGRGSVGSNVLTMHSVSEAAGSQAPHACPTLHTHLCSTVRGVLFLHDSKQVRCAPLRSHIPRHLGRWLISSKPVDVYSMPCQHLRWSMLHYKAGLDLRIWLHHADDAVSATVLPAVFDLPLCLAAPLRSHHPAAG